jgi:hypothetical protein
LRQPFRGAVRRTCIAGLAVGVVLFGASSPALATGSHGGSHGKPRTCPQAPGFQGHDKGGYDKGGHDQGRGTGYDKGGYDKGGDKFPGKGEDKGRDHDKAPGKGGDKFPGKGEDKGRDHDKAPGKGEDKGRDHDKAPGKGDDKGRDHDKAPGKGDDKGRDHDGGKGPFPPKVCPKPTGTPVPPTETPVPVPTVIPTDTPTDTPTETPTETPTDNPSENPGPGVEPTETVSPSPAVGGEVVTRTPAPAADDNGALPVTGGRLALLGLASLLMVAAGIALVAIARRARGRHAGV